MTSDVRAAANRRNAQRSTGPRTPAGKARASGNAFKHGLSLPVSQDPVLAPEIEALARLLAGERAPDSIVMDHARRAAEAVLDLQRIRAIRAEHLRQWLEARSAPPPPPVMPPSARDMFGFDVEKLVDPRRPTTRPRTVARSAAQVVRLVAAQQSWFVRTIERARAEAARTLHRLDSVLERIDRYERRAQSRRKTALRALDAAKAGPPS